MTTEPPSADRIIPARAGFTSHRPRQGRGDQDHPRSRGVYPAGEPPACAPGGSSPLARGLRFEEVGGGGVGGIIPARAGFTGDSPAPSPAPTDHPRSRGVYASSCCGTAAASGSSPLARGLPRRTQYCHFCGRIIPARAGFTRSRSALAVTGRDHPRSRGVYADPPAQCRAPPGSSPLARGLRYSSTACPRGRRIIPARAGFTTPGRGPRTGAPDHPRSRGVYRAPASRARCSAGSSPLARGLQGVLPAQAPAGRIIPARAGFTLLRRTPAPPAPDHPRSRGVYPSTPSRSSASTGSSPLARGLPDAEACNPSARRDHPRSRGVYPSLRDSRNDPSGSSPLARGLREQHRHHGQDRGIIPARAGFTAGADAGGAGVEDHPRSRGVYGSLFFSNLTWSGLSPLARGLPAAQLAGGGALGIIPARAGFTPGLRRCTRPRVGSSPLARGLHGRRGHRAARLRIIPARAGFTRQPWRVSESSPDHPRSRGVYHRCWRLVCGRGGSSPLARGLRREGQESHQPLRIIPARAGFTVGDQDRSEEGVDHPRSRGVYNRP